MEDFPRHIAKWKAKGPHTNNVMKISVEDKEEHPPIAVIMRSGLKTNEGAGEYVLEIRKARGPPPPFNPQQEKATFMEARREFKMNDEEASTSQPSGEREDLVTRTC